MRRWQKKVKLKCTYERFPADACVVDHLYYSRRLHPTGVFVYRVESLQPVISCLQNTQSVTQGSRFYRRSCIQQWFSAQVDYLRAIASPVIPRNSAISQSRNPAIPIGNLHINFFSLEGDISFSVHCTVTFYHLVYTVQSRFII